MAVTTMLLSELRKLPKASTIRIVGAGENATPAVAVAGGCVWSAKLAAALALTVKVLLTQLVKPAALAVNCLLVPAMSS